MVQLSAFRPVKSIGVKQAYKPKSLLLEDLQAEKKVLTKPLTFAVAGGSVPPPGGDDLDKIFKKPFTQQQIKKIHEIVGDSNTIGAYFRNLMENCNKYIK